MALQLPVSQSVVRNTKQSRKEQRGNLLRGTDELVSVSVSALLTTGEKVVSWQRQSVRREAGD